MGVKSNCLSQKYGQDLEPMLWELYINERKTMREIGDALGVSAAAIYHKLKKFGIPTRDRYDHPVSDKVRENARRVGKSRKGAIKTTETRRKISVAKKGKMRNPSKYGGHQKSRGGGYVAIYLPSHPNSNVEGYVMEHRLVMESHIGRYLEKGEVVHHINGDRKDNRLENLQLMTHSEHARLHLQIRNRQRKGETK